MPRTVDRLLRDLAAQVVACDFPRRGTSAPNRSAFKQEISELRRTARGRARVDLIHEAIADTNRLLANAAFYVDAIADQFEIALRREGVLNQGAVTVLLRPVMETGGLALWLLDADVDGVERCRRYLRWRFDELRFDRRFLMDDPREDPEARAELQAGMAEEEATLVGLATACDFTALPSKGDGYAALLGTNGKPEGAPGFMQRSDFIRAGEGLYRAMSMATHNSRTGMRMFEKRLDEPEADLLLSPFGLAPDLSIRMATLAIFLPVEAHARWCDYDVTALRTLGAEISRATEPP